MAMQFSPEAQAEIDRTNAQCRMWAQWFKDAGYSVCAWWAADSPDDPYGYEWQVWTDDRDWWLGPLITIYNHGTGPELACEQEQYALYEAVIVPKLKERGEY